MRRDTFSGCNTQAPTKLRLVHVLSAELTHTRPSSLSHIDLETRVLRPRSMNSFISWQRQTLSSTALPSELYNTFSALKPGTGKNLTCLRKDTLVCSQGLLGSSNLDSVHVICAS